MKIRLRVAGVYFNRMLDVPPNADGSPITIRNAMDYCATKFKIEDPNGFAYSDHSITKPDGSRFYLVQSISHFFSGAYDFNGDGKITAAKDNQGKTLGDNKRDGGLYSLKSSLVQSDPEIRLIWQYYVRENNGDGIHRSRTQPTDNGFASFYDFQLQDNDEVVWRLVSIQFEPTITTANLTRKLALRAAR